MNTIDAKELKQLLEKTQRQFPPHYPTKMHGISPDEIEVLCNNLKNTIKYIGFEDANISIKDIVSKLISDFLISTLDEAERRKSGYCDFELSEENLGIGKKITFKYHDKSLEFEYLDMGFITITNNSIWDHLGSWEDYSNSTISYDINKPDVLRSKQTYFNKSILNSIMTFNERGIEVKKEFKITPVTKNFTPTDQCIIGSVVRNEDFYTATYSIQAIGDDFGGIISKDEIEGMNSISSITVPFRYISNADYDLNLLPVVYYHEKEILGSGAIQLLVYNYNYSDGYDLEEQYIKSKYFANNTYCLELLSDSFCVGLPRITTPYSYRILKNIKEYLHSIDKEPNEK